VRTRPQASASRDLIFTRPDGVEHRRVALADQGLGGRTTKLTLAPSAMTGTWRVKVHTDAKAAPIAQAAFLVEDFVPERLELKLEATTQALSPDQPGTVKVAGRYLYGPPAAGLSIEGEVRVRTSPRDIPGFPGFRFGLADEQVAPSGPLRGLPTTNAEGKYDIAVKRRAEDQPAARSGRDPQAQGIGRAHDRAQRHAPCRLEDTPGRHQAAVRQQPGAAGRPVPRPSSSAPTARPSRPRA
jgi:uncharacterized protein YfaS (alpha-2-macroglobulin family)